MHTVTYHLSSLNVCCSRYKICFKVINHFKTLNPGLLWFVENPDTSLLWARFPELQPQVRLSYCSYGSPYRKNTKVATNACWTPKALCDPATCHACVDGRHVKTAQRGPSKKTDSKEDRCTLDELHRLPKQLCEEIYKICVQNHWYITDKENPGPVIPLAPGGF